MPPIALLPAAGHSRRMGRPKLALQVGERTLLEHVLGTLRRAGIERTLVVLAPHVAFLESLAREAGAAVLLLPEATPDMRATIEQGLDWIQTNWTPQSADRWLLLPPDHPTLDPNVITNLGQTLDANPHATIAVPVHGDKRGHPALIAWSHVEAMRLFPAGQGLNAYLRRHVDQTIELSWPSADVVTDLDTPAEYALLLAPGAGKLVYNVDEPRAGFAEKWEAGILAHNLFGKLGVADEAVAAPAKSGKKLVRYGIVPETVEKLAADAVAALTNPTIRIHGVSVFFRNPVPSSADFAAVAAKFTIHKTLGRGHYTIELPNPVTQQVADAFNRVFGRIP